MIANFRELKVWQKSHELTLFVYTLTKTYPKEELYSLVSQMRRCSISVGANIVEGSKKRTTADLIHYLNIAEGSLEELKYHSLLSFDLNYIGKNDYDKLLSQSELIGIMLNSLKKSLNSRKNIPILS